MKRTEFRLSLASLLMAALFTALAVPSVVAEGPEQGALPKPGAQLGDTCEEPGQPPGADVEPEALPAACGDADCNDAQDCLDQCPSASSATCNSEGFCEYGGSGGSSGGGTCEADCTYSSECVSMCGSLYFCNNGVCDKI